MRSLINNNPVPTQQKMSSPIKQHPQSSKLQSNSKYAQSESKAQNLNSKQKYDSNARTNNLANSDNKQQINSSSPKKTVYKSPPVKKLSSNVEPVEFNLGDYTNNRVEMFAKTNNFNDISEDQILDNDAWRELTFKIKLSESEYKLLLREKAKLVVNLDSNK
jgi:hypothetical protein